MQPIIRKVFLLLSLLPVSTFSQEEQPWSANFFLENDLFADTDLNYTNGVRFSTISPDLESFQDPNGQKYPWVEKLNTMLEFVHPDPANPANDPVHQNMVVSFGQLIFTPEDKERTTLDPDDRPYAGYLYLGLGYHARTANVLHSTEFNFGVVGPASLARQSQDLVHGILGVGKFQGWDNQLENEPVFQLIFERKQKSAAFNLKLFNDLKVETISHWGGSLGNLSSYFNAGAEIRAGWTLPNDFGTSTLRPGGDNNTPGTLGNSGKRLNMHVFMAVDARLIANNIFLDGNTFRNSHSVNKKNAVADVALGVAGSYKKLRFSYAHIYRSREFELQRESQFFGSFSISYHYTL